MDIYRFFHPHHNPRLHSTPVRQQELCELLQAAAELRKALQRAQKRTERRSSGRILPQHFGDIIKGIGFIEQSLETLCDAHDGDTRTELIEMIHERAESPGWETWTSLLEQQVGLPERAEDASNTIVKKLVNLK